MFTILLSSATPQGRPVIPAALKSFSQYENVTAPHLDGDTRIRLPSCGCFSFYEVSKSGLEGREREMEGGKGREEEGREGKEREKERGMENRERKNKRK